MTIEERAIRDHGTTYDPVMATWLTKDGILINGSHEGHQRDVDHHEIGEYFKRSKYEQPGTSSIYIRKFMRRGNVRMGFSSDAVCFEFERPLTREQLNILVPQVLRAVNSGRDVCVGRHGTNGLKYEPGVYFLKYVSIYMPWYKFVPPRDYAYFFRTEPEEY